MVGMGSTRSSEAGAAALGVELWEPVGIVLAAMQGIAGELRLDSASA